MAKSTKLYLPILVLLSLFQTILSNDQTNTGLSFRMIHHDDPESPLYQPNLTTEQRMEHLVQMSDNRALFLNNLMTQHKNNSLFPYITPQAIRPAIGSWGPLYTVKIGIGTFRRETPRLPTFNEYSLFLDTGSDLIWTACEGAKGCIRQQELCFPRSQSSSYVPYPCRKCPAGTTCQRDHCNIEQSYLDGSRMKGILATETFVFPSGDQQRYAGLQNLVFACAIDIKDFIPARSPGTVSGIFGMGRGQLSFAKQVERIHGGQFSYCLQRDGQAGRSPMLLRFGADIPQVVGLRTTPFINQAGDSGYTLQLEGLSVGPRRLLIGSDTLNNVTNAGVGGCVIDSGATLSYINKEAYKPFESALKQHIKSDFPNLKKITCPWAKFQLCYIRIAQGGRQLPTITFHFANNADLVVQPEVYMPSYQYKSNEVYRLEMRSDKITILGAKLQVNYRMIYDITNMQLQFAQQDCSAGN